MVQLSLLELTYLSSDRAHLSTSRMHETAGSGVTFGITNSALPVAYRVPPGLSKTCALTQAFRPSRESRLAVHINDVEAGTGALYPTCACAHHSCRPCLHRNEIELHFNVLCGLYTISEELYKSCGPSSRVVRIPATSPPQDVL